jgi:hypothetical protein
MGNAKKLAITIGAVILIGVIITILTGKAPVIVDAVWTYLWAKMQTLIDGFGK